MTIDLTDNAVHGIYALSFAIFWIAIASIARANASSKPTRAPRHNVWRSTTTTTTGNGPAGPSPAPVQEPTPAPEPLTPAGQALVRVMAGEAMKGEPLTEDHTYWRRQVKDMGALIGGWILSDVDRTRRQHRFQRLGNRWCSLCDVIDVIDFQDRDIFKAAGYDVPGVPHCDTCEALLAETPPQFYPMHILASSLMPTVRCRIPKERVAYLTPDFLPSDRIVCRDCMRAAGMPLIPIATTNAPTHAPDR